MTKESCIVMHVCSTVSNLLQPHGLYVAHQAPLSVGFPQWVAISYFRESSRPRDRNPSLLYLHWQVDSLPLYHLGTQYLI